MRPIIKRFMMNRMEDAVRKMAGMPSRKEQRRQQKRNEAQAREAEESRNEQEQRSYQVNMMRQYAEDIEFTEIKD